MQRQIDPAKHSPRFGAIEEHYDWGFGVLRNFYKVEHTALDVAQQFYHAKSKGFLSKDNKVNYNNRWLQFSGDFIGKTKDVVDTLKANYNFTNAHVYANWIRVGTTMVDIRILWMLSSSRCGARLRIAVKVFTARRRIARAHLNQVMLSLFVTVFTIHLSF